MLDSGRWGTYHQADHYVANPDDTGASPTVTDSFTFYWDEAPGDWTGGTVGVGRDGSIRFPDDRRRAAGNQTLSEGFFGVPWTRVGGHPADAHAVGPSG